MCLHCLKIALDTNFHHLSPSVTHAWRLFGNPQQPPPARDKSVFPMWLGSACWRLLAVTKRKQLQRGIRDCTASLRLIALVASRLLLVCIALFEISPPPGEWVVSVCMYGMMQTTSDCDNLLLPKVTASRVVV